MASRLSKLLAGPREVLRNIIGLEDSPHAIALGVAIGIFYGMTPTVGIQTIFILATVVLTRRFFYFNAPAAIAATYVSNPFTMVPLYYAWYCLGAAFTGGDATFTELKALWAFDDFQGWWVAVQTAGYEIGIPMLVGALITALVSAAIAYPSFYFLLTWLHNNRANSKRRSVDGSGPNHAVQSDCNMDDRQTNSGRSSVGPADTDGNGPPTAAAPTDAANSMDNPEQHAVTA